MSNIPQDQYRLTIIAPSVAEELLSWVMFQEGAEGVQIDDPELIRRHLQAGDWDASVFKEEELPHEQITLTSLFPEEALAQAAKAAVEEMAAEQGWAIETELSLQPSVDWQQEWKKAFRPRNIGEQLWIAPHWAEEEPPAERRALYIEPGMAFGTGDHATTAMALELMELYLQPGGHVLDLGCGSGVLAIGALLLGADRATAIDIDPVCGPSVRHHLELNQIPAERLYYQDGDVLSDEALVQRLSQDRAGLVLANINAAVLKALAPAVNKFVAEDGCFICTGILDEYSADVLKCLSEAGLSLVQVKHSQGWTAFVCKPDFA